MRGIIGLFIDDELQHRPGFPAFYPQLRQALAGQHYQLRVIAAARDGLYCERDSRDDSRPVGINEDNRVTLARAAARFALLRQGRLGRWHQESDLDLALVLSKKNLSGLFSLIGMPYSGPDGRQRELIGDRGALSLILSRLRLKSDLPQAYDPYSPESERELLHWARKVGYPVLAGEIPIPDAAKLSGYLRAIDPEQGLRLFHGSAKAPEYRISILSDGESRLASLVEGRDGEAGAELSEQIRFAALKLADCLKLSGLAVLSYHVIQNDVCLYSIDPAPEDFAATLWAHSDVPLPDLAAKLIEQAKRTVTEQI